jgi:copper chaperone CopZ
MQCNHCKSNVEKAIRAVEGVDNVEIDLASGIATIHGKANITEIQKAVEAIGFECYIKKN